MIAVGALLFLVTSCGKNEEVGVEIPEEEQIEIPTDVLESTAPPAVELAKIQKDGHEYIFEVIGEENEIVILENLYGISALENYDNSITAESNNAFEVFVALTNDNVKVPLRIAATVDESVIEASNREIDESESFFQILDPNYETEVSEMEERGCYDVGWTTFRNNYCGPWQPSTTSDLRFCDPSLKTWLYRYSVINNSTDFKKVRTWTNVVCGYTRISIFDTNGWDQYTKLYEKNLSNGLWWVNLFPNVPEYRVVGRQAKNGGKFRAYTRFSNN